MPLLDTQGNDSADAYGGGAAAVVNYIENVFSTYLYTGNGSTQTITNGIDLSTYGGLVWGKSRSNATGNSLSDTVTGITNYMASEATVGLQTGGGITSANTNGFSLTASGGGVRLNQSNYTYASWTFRKQPKFFDVQTFTQNGGVTVNHNLGSVPACIIIKSTAATDSWYVYHTSLNTPNGNGPRYNYLNLNNTGASTNAGGIWINNITSTSFDITNQVIAPFTTYVAYIFASNAGGFGLTGTDNVITCGSFTTTSSGTIPDVTLGYEPQWVMIKAASTTSDWDMADTMRGWSNTNWQYLKANSSGAEGGLARNPGYWLPTATGFTGNSNLGYGNNVTMIYIAIRRGPMAVPTTGTSVFAPNLATSGSGNVTFTPNFVVDFNISKERNNSGAGPYAITRLLNQSLTTSDTTAAASNGNIAFDSNTSVQSIINLSSVPEIGWSFKRAPSFFDVVCFNGSNTDFTVNHNLQAIPELIILKKRSSSGNPWFVSGNVIGFNSANNNNYLSVNNTNALSTVDLFPTIWNSSSLYMTGSLYFASGATGVGYLFATCPNVSKVGTYTGNGSTQAIACGFTGGARFVLIKRTDAAGDWYVYDTARGMTTLTDPYLLLDSTAAETATLGSVTTTTGGFTVNASILAAINTNGGSYIFLAIA